MVVRAEQSITIANATFDSAVKIDNANRSFFRTNAPAFHQFCEWLRTPVVMPPLTNAEPRGLPTLIQAGQAGFNFIASIRTAAKQSGEWSPQNEADFQALLAKETLDPAWQIDATTATPTSP